MINGKYSLDEFNQIVWKFTSGQLRLSEWYNPVFGIDVIKLDDILHQKFGYKENKHGSMYNFFELTWSKEFADWFKNNMHNVLTIADVYGKEKNNNGKVTTATRKV